MLGWFWDVLPEELAEEVEVGGPPGVERPAAPAALPSGPGALRRPSRSCEAMKWGLRRSSS